MKRLIRIMFATGKIDKYMFLRLCIRFGWVEFQSENTTDKTLDLLIGQLQFNRGV